MHGKILRRLEKKAQSDSRYEPVAAFLRNGKEPQDIQRALAWEMDILIPGIWDKVKRGAA